MPAIPTPFTTALISSRNSVRKRRGSRCSLATRAINPVTRIWQASILPFSSSMSCPIRFARYGRAESAVATPACWHRLSVPLESFQTRLSLAKRQHSQIARKVRVLLRRHVISRAGLRLDAVLDIPQRLEAGGDRLVGNVVEDVGRNHVAQAVQVVDETAASLGQEQSVRAAISGVVTSLEQALLHQAVEQPHERDRLQFEYFSEIDLRQSLLRAQSKQYHPLRARGATLLGTL